MATRKKGRTRTFGKRRTTAKKRASRTVRKAAGPRILVERRGPETLRLRATMPNFTVNDLQRSLKFYTDGLGFVVKERWNGDAGELKGVMLLAGVCELGLSQDDWSKGRGRTKGVGMRIWCQTTQDVDAIARRIKAAGFALTEGPKDEGGGRSLTVDDPDGFRLTIHREGT